MAYSFQEETSDGVKTVYSLAFQYVSRDDIMVYSGTHQAQVAMSFTWVDNATIELTNIGVEAPAGTKFYIRRSMSRTSLIHIFENKSIRPLTLDQQNYQALYLLQEVADGFTSVDGILQQQGDIDMNGFALRELAEPANPQDASTKAYADGLDAATRTYIDDQDAADRQYSDEQDTALQNQVNALLQGKVSKSGDVMTAPLKVPLIGSGDKAEVLSSSQVQAALDTMQRSILDLVEYPLNIEDYGFIEVLADEFEDFGLITDPADEFEDRGRITATGLA